MTDAAQEHQWQERRLGRTILRTYRDTRDLYDVVPNERQPRMGPKEDLELQRQIEANEGIFEPLGPREGSDRIVDALLHREIDVVRRRDLLVDRVGGFIREHRNSAHDDKARDIVDG